MLCFRVSIRFSLRDFRLQILAGERFVAHPNPSAHTSGIMPTPPTPPPVKYGGFVAGFQHYDGPMLLDSLRREMILRLVRDRHNPHDPNAIRIMIGLNMLGYVPRGPNEELARRMDAAEPLVCRIERVNSDTKPWKQCEICIESLSIARPWFGETDRHVDDFEVHENRQNPIRFT